MNFNNVFKLLFYSITQFNAIKMFVAIGYRLLDYFRFTIDSHPWLVEQF